MAKLISAWTNVCATVARMASARARAGRVLVSKSTVTAAPPYWPRVGRLPCPASHRGGHVHRTLYIDIVIYNPFDWLYTDRCASSTSEPTMATAQPAGR